MLCSFIVQLKNYCIAYQSTNICLQVYTKMHAINSKQAFYDYCYIITGCWIVEKLKGSHDTSCDGWADFRRTTTDHRGNKTVCRRKTAPSVDPNVGSIDKGDEVFEEIQHADGKVRQHVTCSHCFSYVTSMPLTLCPCPKLIYTCAVNIYCLLMK